MENITEVTGEHKGWEGREHPSPPGGQEQQGLINHKLECDLFFDSRSLSKIYDLAMTVSIVSPPFKLTDVNAWSATGWKCNEEEQIFSLHLLSPCRGEARFKISKYN